MKTLVRGVVVLILVIAATWMVLGRRADADGMLTASGTVEATDADLGFQVAGRVLEITTEEGDAVTEGTVLARLDARELDAVLEGARAQLEAAEARLMELERGARPQEVVTAEAAVRAAATRAEEARMERDRATTLFEGGAISRQTLERAESAFEVADAALEQAEEQLALVEEGPRSEIVRGQRAVVAQARANVARAEAALANAVVTAPFDGIVSIVHREPGEAVTPGSPVVTLLVPDDRWVRIYVPEDQMGRLRLGLLAEIVSDTYPDRVYEGELVFVGNEAEFTPRNVQTAEERTKLVYPVKVRVSGDPSFELKPGIPVDVTLLAPD